MAASPYYAPTFFTPSFFCFAVLSESTSTVAGLYNAPSYFASSYFYGNGSASPTPSSVPTPYNAPSYFASSYFYGNGSTSPTPTPVPTPLPVPISSEPLGRDQAGYASLMTLIRGLGVFEEVVFGAAIQRNQAGSDCYPLAVLTPQGWEESDETDPTMIVRRTFFGITIVVQSQDGTPQFDQLDRLSSAIVGVVDFADLGIMNIPGLTRIRAGRYDASTHYPEQSVELEGEFSSLIDPQNLNPSTT